MPKKVDMNKILIIGSGPIIIGQACEFDYSGTQACKALKGLGYEIVLVNSNPATIMTDPQIADSTYIEPLNLKSLEKIIAKERPDALLPNLGGQSGLNLCAALSNSGVLAKYGVKVIGVQVDAITRGEDRIAFKETMQKLGIAMPQSEPAYSVREAEEIAKKLGYPCVIRPAYTMGGTGGGLVYNEEELRMVAERGIAASMVRQILVEESVLGWEELELEVVRDAKNQLITVCFIENVDPMGVHTGDSYCVAPMLTVSEAVRKKLQKHAYDIVEAIEVIGGTNVQFAHDPKTGRIVVIEINPRTSRSSALASKATGFPIAYVSALLAAGLTLDEIPYWRFGTLEKYEPYGDYVVVKFSRWAFEKFKGATDKLGTQMHAVGEVMSIGKNYKEALQKAIRSLENGRYGLGFAKNYHELPLEALLRKLAYPSSERQYILYEALRKGATTSQLYQLTHIKEWFLGQMRELVALEEKILSYKGQMPPDELLRAAKRDGFADKYLAQILALKEEDIRNKRLELGLNQAWDEVKVSGVANASYYYSTYCAPDQVQAGDSPKKVMILGGGPNRIGQGIEFDYCCVHAAFALRDLGYETIMVNCNPETVSTDYDTSSKLYFEPLTVEDVYSIYRKENPVGLIVQYGGQTPLNIAKELEALKVPILGTSPDTIDLAEDRDRFRKIMDELRIMMPVSGMAGGLEQALQVAGGIGYPVMVRPSYVLGGRGMEIIHDEEMLARYVAQAEEVTPEKPILIDRFLQHAVEVEVDAVSDGQEVFIPAIMEHIEPAGIHSGDSACVIPPITVTPKQKEVIFAYTKKIAQSLHVVGLMNMQYAIAAGRVYLLEANPRASRTVPLVSKVCNIPMAKIATALMMGRKLTAKELAAGDQTLPYFGVKEAVLPFHMFPEVDPLLGPEMHSTGEVLGLANSFGLAYFKAQEAMQNELPVSGTVLVSLADQDKPDALPVVAAFYRLGFQIVATAGTCAFLNQHGIGCEKINEAHPTLLDLLKNEKIQLVMNTPSGKGSHRDGPIIRRAAIQYKIAYVGTVAAGRAVVEGLRAYRERSGSKDASFDVKSLQEYHREIGR